jgi:hypothetical protein
MFIPHDDFEPATLIGYNAGMLDDEEAITIGLRKYRELYPEGTIPAQLEDIACLGATPGRDVVAVHVTFSIKSQADPFYLFRANVDKATGHIVVESAADWQELSRLELDNSRSL